MEDAQKEMRKKSKNVTADEKLNHKLRQLERKRGRSTRPTESNSYRGNVNIFYISNTLKIN
jgi:hypothetical protein